MNGYGVQGKEELVSYMGTFKIPKGKGPPSCLGGGLNGCRAKF